MEDEDDSIPAGDTADLGAAAAASRARDHQEPLETISADSGFKELPKRRSSSFGGAIALILIAIGLSVLIRIFVGEPYYVPSGSMLETIQIGDRLFGEKVSYRFHGPERGDIVTFADPSGDNVILIKRVIATEGETIDFIDGVVYIDGVALDEPYVQGKPTEAFPSTAPFLPEGIVYPYTVPEGCVWVMGDNRTNSQDLRWFGAIRVDTITSKGLFIFWPPEDAGLL
ncbi:MAG: signal peptidase I [Atopobiaceae bacterium]|nr:signal peptidase I [Atopobiaceae bacterium]